MAAACEGVACSRRFPTGSILSSVSISSDAPPRIDRWPHRWVLWQDFSLPTSTADAVAAIHEAYERAAIERVEIACDGGMGRTGTALAVLATISGIPANDAVDWVRKHYHPQAVETPHQRRWISNVSSQLRT